MKALFLLAFLAACASPAPKFFGADRSDVVREGRSYAVFRKDGAVEVIRLGYARRDEHEGIRATMIDLMTEGTGCSLVHGSLQGDSGEMRGRLRC